MDVFTPAEVQRIFGLTDEEMASLGQDYMRARRAALLERLRYLLWAHTVIRRTVQKLSGGLDEDVEYALESLGRS